MFIEDNTYCLIRFVTSKNWIPILGQKRDNRKDRQMCTDRKSKTKLY